MNCWLRFLCGACLGILLATGCQQAGEPVDEEEADTLAEVADTAAETEASLYERLGGEPAIASVVDTMVARAAADTALNFTRQGTANEWEATPGAVDTLKMRLVEFVAQVTGGPQAYSGGDMGTVHQGMAITDEEFDRLGGHLQYSLDAHDVPAAEQEELMAIVETTRGAIVTAE